MRRQRFQHQQFEESEDFVTDTPTTTTEFTAEYSFPIMDIRSRQKEAMLRMLNLNQEQKDSALDYQPGVWKVLVYDRPCEQILSLLVNRGELKKLGVTFHKLITQPRERVPDVPAIYFVQPTQENIDFIAADLAKNLYDSVYINFSSFVAKPLLESLAKATVTSKSVQRISQVHDQYTEFASLESNLLSLNHRSSFFTLNSPTTTDVQLQTYIDEVVNCLFCVVATMGAIPIIRCKDNCASGMVGEKLNALIFQHLSTRSHIFTNSNANLLNFQRPLMVIADRTLDLATPLHHAWTYQALCHDVLSLKANRCTLPSDDGKAPKVYDMNAADDLFWKENAARPFGDVATAVDVQLKAYKKEADELGIKPAADDMNAAFNPSGATADLSRAISLLPALNRKKEILDQHTIVATAVLKQLKARELDNYFALEEDILNRAVADNNALGVTLSPAAKGSLRDKLRLLAIWYLSGDAPLEPLLATLEFEKQLAAQDPASTSKAQASDLQLFNYLKEYKYINKMAQGPRTLATDSANRGKAASGGVFGSVMESMYGKSVTGLTGLLAGVRNLLPTSSELPLTKVVGALMDNKPTTVTESYAYFDPKARTNKRVPPGPSRQLAPFRDAFVFVLGAGNYSEFVNLQAFAAKTSTANLARSISYGSTDIVGAEEFLEQLARLGRPQ